LAQNNNQLMSDLRKRYTGGCLCGALRYEAEGEPSASGYCCCADCRKASGSGFIPFMGFTGDAVRFSGEARQFISNSFRGTEAVRNFCPVCGSLVFGGVVGKDTSFTIYAGSLDDPSLFAPQIAIFMRDRAHWVLIPPGLKTFETLPQRSGDA
jgi:hypothetical protein